VGGSQHEAITLRARTLDSGGEVVPGLGELEGELLHCAGSASDHESTIFRPAMGERRSR